MPLYNPPPFEILFEEFLEPKNIPVSIFIQNVGISVDDFVALLRGKQSVTPEISDEINKFFQFDVDWVGMHEDYLEREKDHQARRDIVQNIHHIQYALSEYLGIPVNIVQIAEDDDEEDFWNACRKSQEAFEKIIDALEKKEQYIEQKKQLDEYIAQYETQQKVTE